MSEAGELRKRLSAWLDGMPPWVLAPAGQKLSKADVRAVVDVVQNHVRYRDWEIRERGLGPPLTAADVAQKVGRNRNLVARILEALDSIGLTTLVQSHGGNDRTTVRQLNRGFGLPANATDDGVGEAAPTQATVALGNYPNGAPTQPTVAPNASVGGANASVGGVFEGDRRGEGYKGVSDASLASSLEGRSYATPSRPPSAPSRPSVATTVDR